MASYADFVGQVIGEPVAATGADILEAHVSNYMIEGAQVVVNAMPKEMLWAMETNQDFVDDNNAAEGVAVGSNKILQVVRETDGDGNSTPPFAGGLDTDLDGVLDTSAKVECREIPAALSGRAAVGSGWQEEASQTDPVYYKLDGKVNIIPTSTKGGSKVHWVKVPPTTWEPNAQGVSAAYNVTFMAGTILQEIEPLIMLYVLKKVYAQKLALAQFGTVTQGSSLETYIADEDLEMAQGQQLLITDLQSMLISLEKEFQLGIQLLMQGTYKPELLENAQTQDTYAKLQGKGA
jgi:hypothetical protein